MRHVRPSLALKFALALALMPLPSMAASQGQAYAADRAEIENLAARYLFALDGRDADTYASTFTKDGILVYAAGELQGRDAIRDMVNSLRARAEEAQKKDTSKLRPARGRHNITNLIVEVDGDKATAKSYWTSVNNNNPERRAQISAYGHYEDQLVKVDGKWLFSRREIFNEQLDHRAAPGAPSGSW